MAFFALQLQVFRVQKSGLQIGGMSQLEADRFFSCLPALDGHLEEVGRGDQEEDRDLYKVFPRGYY